MSRSLFERLSTWARLFALRPDVEAQQPLQIATPGSGDERNGPSTGPAYPSDAIAFAKHGTDFSFQYQLTDADSTRSMLFLNFDRYDESRTYLSFNGHKERLSAFAGADADWNEKPKLLLLDCDRTGIGHSAYYLYLANGTPFVLWDVEAMIGFSSLEDYVTEGAKHGFVFGNRAWPTARSGQSAKHREDPVAPLRQRSLPSSTPTSELRAALVAQGASEHEADDLLEWLGPAASLLVALPAGDPRRESPRWYASAESDVA